MADTPLRADSVRDNSADALLQRAWADRRAAYDRYNALPADDDWDEADGETPAGRAEWAKIDAAELTIRTAIASSPRGTAIQLWTALQHCISDRPDEAAVLRRDLHWFDDDEARDWHVRLILSALRSLDAMEAAYGRS